MNVDSDVDTNSETDTTEVLPNTATEVRSAAEDPTTDVGRAVDTENEDPDTPPTDTFQDTVLDNPETKDKHKKDPDGTSATSNIFLIKDTSTTGVLVWTFPFPGN